MITPFAIIQLIIAGFSLASCVIVIIYIWARKRMQPFWPLVLYSFMLMVFSISKMFLNSTQDINAAVSYYRIMSICMAILFQLTPVFYKRVFSFKTDFIDYFIFFIYGVYGIGNLFAPLTLDYAATSPMVPMDLGLLGTIYSVYNWEASIIAPFVLIIHFLVIFYTLRIAILGRKKWKHGGNLLISITALIIVYMAYHLLVGIKFIYAPGFVEFIGFVITLSCGIIVFTRERSIITEMKLREENLASAWQKIDEINQQLKKTNEELQNEIDHKLKIEESLLESEDRYKGIANNIPGFVYQYFETIEGERGLCYVDKRSYEMFEIECDPLETWFDRFSACLAPDDKARLLESMYKNNGNENVWSFEANFFKPSGCHIIIRAFSQLVNMTNKKLWNGLVLDITEQKNAEEKLKKSEHIFSTIFHKSPMGMAIIDFKTNKILEVNNSWLELTGYSKEECVNKRSMELGLWVNPEQQKKFVEILLSTGQVKNFELISRKKNGEHLITVMNSEMIYLNGEPAVLSISEDITKRKKDEEALNKSLVEKDMLLRELYHRTKNNMQIICSLLQLQASSINDSSLVKILSETENRIRTMALVHQKLYQTKDLSLIDLGEYAKELVNMLFKLFSARADKIKIKMEFEEIPILIDYGVTIGLILNEIVSNTFKYAFPGNKEGIFQLKIFKDNSNITMILEDNGVGFADDVNLEEPETLGMQLINSLVTCQLNGTLDIDTKNGVKYTISFEDNLYEKRI